MSQSAQVHQPAEAARLHGLDTLRSAAILLVIVFHLQSFLPAAFAPLAGVGWTGVDLFFVLSGFLIGSELLRPYARGARPSLRVFYLKRSLRILPAYFVVLTLYLLWPAWREFPGPVAPWQFWTFTWNLVLRGFPDAHAFSHAWSLCVEEHFYLLLPFVLLLLMRRPTRRKAATTFCILIAGGILLRGYLLFGCVLPAGPDQAPIELMRRIYYPTYTRLDGLVVGVALAAFRCLWPQRWVQYTRRTLLATLSGAVLLVLGMTLFGMQPPSVDHRAAILVGFPILACGYGCLVFAAAAPGSLLSRRVPGARPLATLSFSLYLTHKAVAHLLQAAFPAVTSANGWLAALLYLCGCLAAAALLYAVVERPAFRLRAALLAARLPATDTARALAAR